MKKSLGLGLFLIVILNCSQKKKSPDYSSLYPLITGQSTTPTCSATPSFSTLAAAGTTTNCISCHGIGGTAQALMDITSYTSVKSHVTIGNPNNSSLYAKITTGNMATYSNSSINNAVYCWILGGANP